MDLCLESCPDRDQGLLIAECKEKWRNLRTVFMRKMKLPSGTGVKKKAYYLEHAMQFCLPFIKTSAPPSSGNLPEVPQPEITDEVLKSEEACDSVPLEDSSHTVQILQPHSPQSAYKRTEEIYNRANINPPVQSSSSRTKRKLMLRDQSALDADQCVAAYFKAKTVRLESSANLTASSPQNIDRKEALKMFLLSLMPELLELCDSQIKLFKRRVFSLIDEVSSSSQTPDNIV